MPINLTELDKLKAMLTAHGIPWEPYDESCCFGVYHYTMHRVKYPSKADCVCSVILGTYSIGAEAGLLEIRGLAKGVPSVDTLGWLTAEDVFQKIFKHWEGQKIYG